MGRIPLKHLTQEERNRYYDERQRVKFEQAELRAWREELWAVRVRELNERREFVENFRAYLQAEFASSDELRKTPIKEVYERVTGKIISNHHFNELMDALGFEQKHIREGKIVRRAWCKRT